MLASRWFEKKPSEIRFESTKTARSFPARSVIACSRAAELGPARIGLQHPRRGRDGRVHHGHGAARLHPVEVTLGRGLQDVARQVQIGAGGAHDGRGHGVPLARHAQVGDDRTRLLREAGLVQPADGQARMLRRRAAMIRFAVTTPVPPMPVK